MMDEIGIRKCEISCQHLTELTKLNQMHATKSKVDSGSSDRLQTLSQNMLRSSSDRQKLRVSRINNA